MRRPRRLITVLAVAALLVPASAAHAGFFPGEIIDGPDPDLVRVGGVDLARDGTGAVVYVRKDGGVDHIFASRLTDGGWNSPERVDAGLGDAASQPVVAASDGGRLVVAFLSGGSLYAVVRPAGATAWPAPQLIGPATDFPSVAMSINGAAYITYTLDGDIRAARLDRTSTTFAAIPDVLDVNQSEPAGDTQARRSDVAISADGTGVAVWGERGTDGRGHVYARRLFSTSISTAPQDLTLSDFQGHSAGDASNPDVKIEDDSSFAWVVFRQMLDGTPRAIARRLVGSIFQDPSVIDPLPFPTPEGVSPPVIDMNGTGQGLAAEASTSSRQVYLAALEDDAFGFGAPRVDSVPANAVDPDPLTGVAQSGAGFVAWLQSAGQGDPVAIHGRLFDVKPGPTPQTSLTDEAALTTPDLGAVDPSLGWAAAADRVNDAAVVAIQRNGVGELRLVGGMIDRPPGNFVTNTSSKVRRLTTLSWGSSSDLWGKLTYSIEVDGKVVGQTQATRYAPDGRIRDGVHRWRVIVTDRRGQTNATATHILRVDDTPPRLVVHISGARKAGTALKFRFTARDVLHRGASGLARVHVSWGDGSPALNVGKTAAHVYHRGRFTLRVTAIDRVGNATVVTRRLVIKQ